MKNKGTLFKFIISLIVIIPLLFWSYSFWKGYSFKTNLAKDISENYNKSNHKVILKNLTCFNWDYVTWIYHGDSYGTLPINIGNVLRFYSKEKLVAEINLNKKHPQVATFKNCGCPENLLYSAICFTPQTAIFKIEGNSASSVFLKSIICN